MRYLIPILCLLMLVACGSDSPTDPGDGGGGSTFEDTPPIPRPTSPGGSVPSQSNVLMRVTSGTLGNFAPRVLNINLAEGKIFGRAKTSCFWGLVETRTNFPLTSWTGDASYAVADCGSAILSLVAAREAIRPQGHMSLVSGGAANSVISREGRAGFVLELSKPLSAGFVRTEITPANPLAETPHLRRDRYWRLRSLAGGVGDFLLLTGPTSGEISTTYTRGVERSQTESFGRSVTGEVSASYGVVSASVSATLSEEFSSSVSVSESRSETFTQTVRGEEGKTIQFMVWELVEIYSFTNSEGETFEAEGWAFDNQTLTRTGAALALDATTFTAN